MLWSRVWISLCFAIILTAALDKDCKCTPNSNCWPSLSEWSELNTTLAGQLIRSKPAASVCYPSEPNYNEDECGVIRSQWFNSSWHAEDPTSIDYPIWANNSCNPIFPDGSSVTGDLNAGSRGCSIGNYPVYVVNATKPEHVSATIKWVREKNVRLVVKNTGHSYPGRSIAFGSLSIWTHHLRGIEFLQNYTPECQPTALMAARISAGETGVRVLAEMAKHDAIVVTGGNPDVGLIGWLTGGGHGLLSTSYGMGADNLFEATIVTPSGDVLVANPCQNSDLFFAIRGGGGGTYGVVLEVVVQAFRTPQTTLHSFSVNTLGTNDSQAFWDIVAYIHGEFPRLKDAGMQGYYFIIGPPLVGTLSLLWGFMLYDKPNGTVETAMAPIKAHLDKQSTLFAYESSVAMTPTFFDMYGASASNELVANGGSAYGSRLLSEDSLSDVKRVAEIFAQIGPSSDYTKPNGLYSNPLLLGHMIASSHPPSYFPDQISMNPAWRETLSHVIVAEGWADGASPPDIRAVYDHITNNKTEALRRLSPDTGAYFNEGDSYEPEWQNSFFGQNYARLLQVKQRYDPEGLFWCRRCVGSEDWNEVEDGMLCRVNRSTST